MSKTGRMKSLKKIIEKVDHSSTLKTYIPAGLASPAPPLGPMLGQVSFLCRQEICIVIPMSRAIMPSL